MLYSDIIKAYVKAARAHGCRERPAYEAYDPQLDVPDADLRAVIGLIRAQNDNTRYSGWTNTRNLAIHMIEYELRQRATLAEISEPSKPALPIGLKWLLG